MKKTVSFYYTLVCAILTFVTMLFVSCAGGTSSTDGDIGYLSFGSSRALGLSDKSHTVNDLQNLKLTGTRNGRTTTLGSWASYSEIPGTSISLQAGNWTFELTGTAQATGIVTVDHLFTSEKSAVIKAGEDNVVAFTMTYAGTPANQGVGGSIILSNGYALSVSEYNSCPELVAKYPAEAVQIVVSGVYYGINFNVSTNTMDYPVVEANAPAGYSIPPREVAEAISASTLTDIRNAFTAVGRTFPNSGDYWTSFTNSGPTNHWPWSFNGGYVTSRNDVGGGGSGSLYVKQF